MSNSSSKLALPCQQPASCTVMQRSDPRMASEPFPFERLPKELRLQILKQTGLIAGPRGDELSQRGFVINHSGKWLFRQTCCTRCGYDRSQRCDCLWRYGSFSETCLCSFDPLPILLTSRRFYQEAVEALYSNRISFQSELLSKRALERRSSILRFFLQKAPSTLWFMRNITFDLGGAAYVSWKNDKAQFDIDWNSLIDRIAAHCNLAVLVLTVRCYHGTTAFYNEIFPCFRKLKGLKGFIVYQKLEMFQKLERGFEQDVMGDDYNSDEWRVPRSICFRI